MESQMEKELGLEHFLEALGAEIEDVDEETFSLFTLPLPASRPLGFHGSAPATASTSTKAPQQQQQHPPESVTVTLRNRALTIHQSPTLLASANPTGTTGAVLWSVTPLLARWLAHAANPLFRRGIAAEASTVLELGCGVSSLLAFALAPRVAAHVCTDQEYVFKLLRRNLEENAEALWRSGVKQSQQHHHHQHQPGKTARAPKSKKPSAAGGPAASAPAQQHVSNVQTLALDWETADVSSLGAALEPPAAAARLDLVLAADCVYNYHLVEPFVRTCEAACRLRRGGGGGNNGSDGGGERETVCLVAQQLRSEEIFEEWLRAFARRFRVWRVPDELLEIADDEVEEGGQKLRADNGFVVHVGILRD